MKTGIEIAKWGYTLIVSMVMFLFFCLFLDLFCFLAFGGWQPLLGNWPIFSGSVSLVFFGDPWKVLILIFGLAGTARIMLGSRMPGLLEMIFQSIENGNSKGNVEITEGNEIDKE